MSLYTCLNGLFLFVQDSLRQHEAENLALREAISEKDAESQKHLNILDLKLQELEHLKKNIGTTPFVCNLFCSTYRMLGVKAREF